MKARSESVTRGRDIGELDAARKVKRVTRGRWRTERGRGIKRGRWKGSGGQCFGASFFF
jgi:hypothetical protein